MEFQQLGPTRHGPDLAGSEASVARFCRFRLVRSEPGHAEPGGRSTLWYHSYLSEDGGFQEECPWGSASICYQGFQGLAGSFASIAASSCSFFANFSCCLAISRSSAKISLFSARRSASKKMPGLA